MWFIIKFSVIAITSVLIEKRCRLFEKFYALYSYYHEKNHDTVKSFYNTIQMTFYILYAYIQQKLMHNVVWINKKEYEVHYFLSGNLFKIKLMAKRGPRPFHILKITNETGADITTEIIPYLGPYYDWHSIHYTPTQFGHQQLCFHINDGRNIHFRHSDESLINLPVKIEKSF